MKKHELNQIINRWRKYYASMGVSREDAMVHLNYAVPLLKKDLPPIFDLLHLGLLLGVKQDFLISAVNGPESFYRSFSIPKRSGGSREITAPYPSLKYVQRWILDNIVSKGRVHGCANGFIKGKSIVSNAKMHIGQKYLLKIDIKDFFPSIKINWVIQVFLSMGYSQRVAFYLASLCCCNGHLPQGSPASPMLSNIVAYHLDRRLYRLAKKFGLKFSRYADDIAFSGDIIDKRFIFYVFNIIQECGFLPNTKKTRLYNGKGKRILTGISIGDAVLRLPREYRRDLEKELHYIKRYGMWSHMEHNKISNPNYPQSIFGKVNFWLMVEPDNDFAKEMRRILIAYLP